MSASIPEHPPAEVKLDVELNTMLEKYGSYRVLSALARGLAEREFQIVVRKFHPRRDKK